MSDTILQIVYVLISFLIGIGGTYWLKVKKYIGVAKEFADVFVVLYDAGVDDNVTEAEFQAIAAEIKEAYLKAKAIKSA